MKNTEKSTYHFGSDEDLKCLKIALEKVKKLDLFGHFKKENELKSQNENSNKVA